MKFTLSECVDRINQTLNFPSVAYEDISLFFDQAIAELNTTLHIQIRPISELVKNYTNNVKFPNLVLLKTDPALNSGAIPVDPDNVDDLTYYYDSSSKTYAVKEQGVWRHYTELYGVRHTVTESTFYKAVAYSVSTVVWTIYEGHSAINYDLTEVLPRDWITLYLIPYVCFKYAVRDGDNGTLYADEFAQGFQQLQNAYDVPSTVKLTDVIGIPAYLEDIKDNLGNLNITIPTRAILDSMLHSRVARATYGGMYDNGGWGI